MRIIASNNPDNSVRLLSSAGGVYTLIAEQVIADGGVVYGAGFNENWHVVHQHATTSEELARLRGSKYVFSDYLDTVKLALTDLEAGKKVLFSGTPCQVAVMKKRASDNDRLLLVEVVCHGAPEPRYWDMYLDALCRKLKRKRSEIKNINFRDKITGWKGYSITIHFADGTAFTQRSSKNLYMRAFLKDYTLRKPCFKCPFKYPDGSRADITLGDFWGIDKVAPDIDNNQGTTIVIARTKKGEKAIEQLQAVATPTLVEIARFNPAITTPAIIPAHYEDFQNHAKCSTDVLRLFQKYAAVPLKQRFKDLVKRILQGKS